MSIYKDFKSLVMHRSRSKKLDHFYSLCEQQSNVLDVGVSKHKSNDHENMFLNTFRFDSNQYTGLAIQPMKEIAEMHPGKRFVEYPGGAFPFRDKEFDWVFSNAVIEHVGVDEEKILFINEMLRVSKNVFFTTPNKYFPIESHTNVIFRHWFTNSFHKWAKKKYPKWREERLLLLGSNDLKKLLVKSNAKNYLIQKNRMLGWPMTLTVVCSG